MGRTAAERFPYQEVNCSMLFQVVKVSAVLYIVVCGIFDTLVILRCAGGIVYSTFWSILLVSISTLSQWSDAKDFHADIFWSLGVSFEAYLATILILGYYETMVQGYNAADVITQMTLQVVLPLLAGKALQQTSQTTLEWVKTPQHSLRLVPC